MSFHAGNLPAGQARILGELTLDQKTNQQDFNVFISARNGTLTQTIRALRIEDKWMFASRVTRGEDVLRENIPEGFPPDAVDWKK